VKNVLDPSIVKHAPVFDTEKAVRIYEKKDGVSIKYVCTTDLQASDLPVDIFYREDPHPEFGNRYFGLYQNPYSEDAKIMITNADIVENYAFGMIKDKEGMMWYSQCHHDCLFIDGAMIDGGRQYVRGSNISGIYKLVNGEFVEKFPDEDEETWPGQDSGIEYFGY
jgi:hypothetical protein